MIADGIAGSSRTLSRMAKLLREVCVSALNRLKERGMRIGGRHRFVVVDESKFAHKRKYHRGRCGNTWRRKRTWVFGMLEVNGHSRRPILRLVKNRSRRNLLRHIRRHVRTSACIVTDEWRAYKNQLSQYGYRQFSVWHKQNFVNPENNAHTQHIERAWQTYKNQIWRLRGNRTPQSLATHLKMIEWYYWLGNRHRNGVLGRLVHDLKKLQK
ncbi:hypothetical protein ACEWY4_015577 [Coilia grayii]|uniref:ISXO2-like transposase domain-containing protein n=1 Tax=Coilia grayii TaxID=363190 RepID=A0ABD1JNE2_9TELE